jgi:hypothetical protein
MMGGPGCGKSTVAAWMFASMKAKGHEIEYVTEVVKNWTFLRRPPEGFDQIYLFGKQMNREDIVLRYKDNFLVVTDSPLFMSCCYAEKYKTIGWAHLWGIAEEFEQVYPAIHIFLKRPDSYKETARFQGEMAAKDMDSFCRESLSKRGIHFNEFACTDTVKIGEFVEPLVTRLP